MATDLRPAPFVAPRRPVSLWHRIYGFGSIYAKSVRDSRLTFIIVAGLLGGMMLVAGAGVGTVYSTPESRADIVRLATEIPPILQGFSGPAINVGTVGGYIAWKYGPYIVFIAAIWSILALSGTLASEARRGSLEFVASAPFGRRRVALEKLAAHVTVLTAAMAVLALAAWLAGTAFGTLPGDAISPSAAIGYALWVGLIALASGSVAWVLAPFIGRAGSAGIAGFVLIAAFLVNGYSSFVPVLGAIANLSWFSWTAGHQPLAGMTDWPSLIPVALVAIVLLALGTEAFSRRDLGASSAIATPGLPRAVLGVRGPVGRSFGERLPTALAWGIGLGVFGFVIAAASGSLADAFKDLSPDTLAIFNNVFPNIDITSAGGFLQVVFIELGFIIVGFAAATLVAGWASDETSGRLEMLIATPLGRARWAIRSGIGVYLAIAVMTVVLGLAVGFGAALAGSDALTPAAGAIVLGLYTAALAGIGFAVGGLIRTSIAAEVVAVIVVLTFLIDLLGPALRLPDGIHQLALSAHLGQPMVGIWDGAGIVACVVIAVGGLALGGWGMRRRDLAR